jgi:hypothetical protein
MNVYWYEWAGYLGVALVLLAFLLMQAHKLHGNGLVYQLMNVLGAVGVTLSLALGEGPVNWPALMMQVAWIVIGVYGIARSARVRRELRARSPAP